MNYQSGKAGGRSSGLNYQSGGAGGSSGGLNHQGGGAISSSGPTYRGSSLASGSATSYQSGSSLGSSSGSSNYQGGNLSVSTKRESRGWFGSGGTDRDSKPQSGGWFGSQSGGWFGRTDSGVGSEPSARKPLSGIPSSDYARSALSSKFETSSLARPGMSAWGRSDSTASVGEGRFRGWANIVSKWLPYLILLIFGLIVVMYWAMTSVPSVVSNTTG